MKIKIAICDDEYIHREILLQYIGKLFSKDIYEISEFNSGEDLLANYPNDLDILLLDVQMLGINGIETAKKIRLFDTKVTIVFTTAISDFMQEGYEVRAFRYLLKPINYIDFSKHLIQCKNEVLKNKEKYISIKEIDEGKTIIIPINSILYIEVECRVALIHTDTEIYKTRESIKNLELQLTEYSFFRCHRAYLINLFKVNAIDKNSVFIKGNEILVSRYKIKDLKSKITDILGSLI
ncbi:DNA-binding response regulator [Paraclostridium bifermentans]|uniref:LytR/AlgR family response regulator transcription factor n=1 Tax=Paraclostridium bifermentans TaxID=1490 RepID=UPI001F2D83A0|nr:LytTR family DNA-binding domain-containing protein [Paraclostridium bifermentans]MCE9676824.1 LytTR family DNA-binding domain-containing protein [Paraclostridium bifermentans]MCR1877232.1 LytTR family DNA-binding domain-containing protein [Paraclostridium bifermentans]GKZ04739.1 DNA-binding response regulator [Paraclostridium bifermentans]GKZ06993.1 DNA-binding response regulator [Paraclostridium bifermentans]GKZ11078.1 DNA-binding response regulator [Paraclostridium bifermentans]